MNTDTLTCGSTVKLHRLCTHLVSLLALEKATEGAARLTVLRVTHVEPSHGFVECQALVDGFAPKSSNDPATALRPILATPKKDARTQRNGEWKEKLTASSIIRTVPVQVSYDNTFLWAQVESRSCRLLEHFGNEVQTNQSAAPQPIARTPRPNFVLHVCREFTSFVQM